MRLAAVYVDSSMMNRLVMDYLVIEGHKEAAECFMAESGTDSAQQPSALTVCVTEAVDSSPALACRSRRRSCDGWGPDAYTLRSRGRRLGRSD